MPFLFTFEEENNYLFLFVKCLFIKKNYAISEILILYVLKKQQTRNCYSEDT